VAFEDGTNVDRWIAVGRARICNECLENVSWAADGQQTARLRRRASETVGRAPWNDEYFSRSERTMLARGLEFEVPFEDDEGLLPGRMSVQCDAGAWLLERLDDAVRAFLLAIAPLKGELERAQLVRHAVHFAEILEALGVIHGLRLPVLRGVAKIAI
jgi:hypothetical protein